MHESIQAARDAAVEQEAKAIRAERKAAAEIDSAAAKLGLGSERTAVGDLTLKDFERHREAGHFEAFASRSPEYKARFEALKARESEIRVRLEDAANQAAASAVPTTKEELQADFEFRRNRFLRDRGLKDAAELRGPDLLHFKKSIELPFEEALTELEVQNG